jgi:hypothetical protein
MSSYMGTVFAEVCDGAAKEKTWKANGGLATDLASEQQSASAKQAFQ